MTERERSELQTAILTICDPRGNWHYGWSMICRLANMDAAKHPAPFKIRTEEDLRELGRGDMLLPEMPRTRQPDPKTG